MSLASIPDNDAAEEKRWQQISIDRSDVAYECVMRPRACSRHVQASSGILGYFRHPSPSPAVEHVVGSDGNSSRHTAARGSAMCWWSHCRET